MSTQRTIEVCASWHPGGVGYDHTQMTLRNQWLEIEGLAFRSQTTTIVSFIMVLISYKVYVAL